VNKIKTSDTAKLTDTDRAVLTMLKQPCTCTAVGEQIWGGVRMPQAYARPGGKAIQRLVRLGLVKRVYPSRWQDRPPQYAVSSWKNDR
jgi:hypothetical protein